MFYMNFKSSSSSKSILQHISKSSFLNLEKQPGQQQKKVRRMRKRLKDTQALTLSPSFLELLRSIFRVKSSTFFSIKKCYLAMKDIKYMIDFSTNIFEFTFPKIAKIIKQNYLTTSQNINSLSNALISSLGIISKNVCLKIHKTNDDLNFNFPACPH